MTVYSIYHILNTANGKSYIGFTSKPPEMRWMQHHRRAQSSHYQRVHHLLTQKTAKNGRPLSPLRQFAKQFAGLYGVTPNGLMRAIETKV